jgi:two-component system chemotaxis response regulator CheY
MNPDTGPLVLVVDDSATVRLYHRTILTEAGFSVREAANGYEALELTLAETFELVVVDINMPVMDGYTFVESLRRNASLRDVPVVMVSSEAEMVDYEEAYRRGADLYVVKPADPSYLVQVVRQLISTGRPARSGGRP